MIMQKILIINGPNLNMLDKRDVKIYGNGNLEKAKQDCNLIAKEINFSIDFKQSNSEADIIDFIQQAIDIYDGIIINAAAYTHSSVAIRDALEIFHKPKIELHISNIFKREQFRHHSYISPVVDAVISGLGIDGYAISVFAMKNLIEKNCN
jgi:3-dehydroquinate dehydratase-2